MNRAPTWEWNGLIAPACDVGALGRGLEHVRLGFSEDALGKGLAAFAGGAAWGAGVAVRLVDAVVEGGVGVGVGGGFERVLHQVDGAIEEKGVGCAYHDVEFALELGAKGFPVALQDRG